VATASIKRTASCKGSFLGVEVSDMGVRRYKNRKKALIFEGREAQLLFASGPLLVRAGREGRAGEDICTIHQMHRTADSFSDANAKSPLVLRVLSHWREAWWSTHYVTRVPGERARTSFLLPTEQGGSLPTSTRGR
jgi:hypothetical protein